MVTKKKHHLTKQGLKKVKEELDQLKKVKISKIQGEGPESFSFGNVEPEFLAFRQEMAQLEERIAEIEDVLEHHDLIKTPTKKEQDKIYLGALVTVEAKGEVSEFIIIDALEANPSLGRISDECPLGMALLVQAV